MGCGDGALNNRVHLTLNDGRLGAFAKPLCLPVSQERRTIRPPPRHSLGRGNECDCNDPRVRGGAAAGARANGHCARPEGVFWGVAIGLMLEEDLFLPPASLERAQHIFSRLLLLCSQVSCVAWTRSTKATGTGHHRRRHNTRHRYRWQRRQTTDIIASPGGCGVCWVLCD